MKTPSGSLSITNSCKTSGTITYAWDPEDRLTDLTAPWGTVYSFGYDGEGRRTSLTSTSGRNSTYGYTNGLLTALSHVQSGATLTDLTYAYGVDGQLTAMVDNLDPAKSKAMSYDQLNRLVQVAEGIPVAQGGVPIPIEDYAYDEEGNRTTSHLSALYTSNPHNQLTEDGSYTYAYDARGNRVSRTAKATGAVETYEYDFQNRLIEYTSPTTVASYAYDAIERRIAKTVNGVTTAYIHDQDRPDTLDPSNIILEFNGVDLTSRWAFSDRIDEPLGAERYTGTQGAGTGASHILYANREGAISRVVEEATNSVVAAYGYDAFGLREIVGGTFDQPYGYRGREFDAETGLYHLRWRTYDPDTGQFLQMDPIGFASGQENLYAYVDNNPFMAGDPMGLVASSEVRAMSDGKMQTLGSATRSVSSGVFDLIGATITKLGGVWTNYPGSPQQVGNAFDGLGSGGHGNSHCDNRGQHLYVIYRRDTGKSIKFGIGNSSEIYLNGSRSRRADRQIPALQAQYNTSMNHTVLVVIPGGMMARGQAAVMERMMVAYMHTLGFPPLDQGRPGNDQDFCPTNGRF